MKPLYKADAPTGTPPRRRSTGRLWLVLPMAALLGLSACGEYSQVVEYSNGKYRGKADTHPYESAAYKGDKAIWQSDIRARMSRQTEVRSVTD